MSISGIGWRTPMVVITAGCIISFLTFGTRSGFGLFLAPMSADLGWGREVFALAMAIQNLLWGIGQPVAGMLADRYGSGRVLAVGGGCYALGVYLMANTATPAMLYLSTGGLIGIGLAGASFAVVLASIGRMVSPERRSLALGIGTAAGSFGQFVMVPAGQAFLDAYGWSVTLLILSALVLLVIPLSTALTGRAEGAGLGRDQSIGEALREAGGHAGFLYLTAGFFVCGFHVAFIAVHLPAYLTDNGMSGELGAWALGLVGLFNIIGSIGSGILGGRYSKKYLLSILYFLRAVAIALFVTLPITLTTVMLFAAAIGLLWLSTVPLTSGLVAQIFGPRYMATLFGIVFFSHQVGSFLGVWLGGYLYDTTGSYDVVWWVGVALGVAAAIIHFPIDERQVARLADSPA